MSYIYKCADQDWEFQAIHRLNYQTFCEEIPQHAKRPVGILIDRFHDENSYFICLSDKELVGMVCLRDQRPFSLDEKLENLDSYLPPFVKSCEMRLLAVSKGHRKGVVVRGLFELARQYCQERSTDILLISGFVGQLGFYSKLGLKPFGPLTGTPHAQFQPMYLTWESYRW